MSSTAITPVNRLIQEIQAPNFQRQLAMALPRHLTPERQMRVLCTALQKVPKLAQCDRHSLFGSIITASQLGLEVCTPLGHAHLIPYKQTCQLIIGYQGYVDLAWRSGRLVSIRANVVRDGDVWEYEEGLHPKLRHIPSEDGTGALRRVYAIAEIKDGGIQHVVLNKGHIEKARASSASSRGSDSPWNTNEEEMWKKTAIRRLAKLLPLSVEFATALTLDEQADMGVRQSFVITQDPTDDVTDRTSDAKAKAEKIRDRVEDVPQPDGEPSRLELLTQSLADKHDRSYEDAKQRITQWVKTAYRKIAEQLADTELDALDQAIRNDTITFD